MADETTEAVPEDGEAQAGEVQEEDNSETEAAPWRDEIKDEKVRKFAESFTSPSDLAEKALGMRQKLSNAISVPGEDASEEDIADYRKKIGIPDSPDAYDVTVPELPEALALGEAGEERVQAMVAEMHRAGVSNQGVQTALDLYFNMITQDHQDHQVELVKGREAVHELLKNEMGQDYERSLQVAKKASEEFGSEAFINFINRVEVDGVKLGDHAEFIRTFSQIGARMTEHGFQTGLGGEEAVSVQEEIDAIYSEHFGKESYNSPAVQSKLAGLFSKQTGGAPIVGDAGRTT